MVLWNENLECGTLLFHAGCKSDLPMGRVGSSGMWICF